MPVDARDAGGGDQRYTTAMARVLAEYRAMPSTLVPEAVTGS